MPDRVPVPMLDASGSSFDGTKVLYDDGTWKIPSSGSPGGGATHSAEVYQTVGQTIANGVFSPDWTYLTFGEVRAGDSGLWSTANPSRLYFPADGTYDLNAGWASTRTTSTSADNLMGIRLYNADGSIARNTLVESRGSAGFNQARTVSTQVTATAGQYVRVYVFQGTGASVTTDPAMCFVTIHAANKAPAAWKTDPLDPTVLTVEPGAGVAVDPADSSVLMVG